MTKLGIIGGSGLYDIEGLEALHTQTLDTPFGTPSDQFTCGRLHDVEVVFLPRHGPNHTLLPHELTHSANIHAMQQLGVTHLLSISAVGSLTEEMRPRDVVIIDQYFDRTKRGGETQTFFGGGVAAHIAFGHPVCPELSSLAAAAAREAIAGSEAPDRRVFATGTYVNIEGPAFSTQAESRFHRDNHLSVVGMTNLAEAKLAREAELCYCTVAMVTVRSFVPTGITRSQCRRTSISVLPLATSGASSAHCTVAYSTSSDSTLEARETRPASSAKALASAQMRTTPWCAGDR